MYRACDKCKGDKRKTINGDDLLYSLYQLGFERYLENLNSYYAKYKDVYSHLMFNFSFRQPNNTIKQTNQPKTMKFS